RCIHVGQCSNRGTVTAGSSSLRSPSLILKYNACSYRQITTSCELHDLIASIVLGDISIRSATGLGPPSGLRAYILAGRSGQLPVPRVVHEPSEQHKHLQQKRELAR